MPITPLHKKIMSLLLLTDRLAAEDISSEIKVEADVIAQQLFLLGQADLLTVDRTEQQTYYSINETHLNEIIEFVSQLTQDNQ